MNKIRPKTMAQFLDKVPIQRNTPDCQYVRLSTRTLRLDMGYIDKRPPLSTDIQISLTCLVCLYLCGPEITLIHDESVQNCYRCPESILRLWENQ